MKRFTVMIIAILAIVMFTIPAMAGERTETVRYEYSGVFECKITEVRDTRRTLGYKSWDDWRYKSTDGHRYKIEVDFSSSRFYNCEVARYKYKVVARQHGDWSWEGIRINAVDRMKPWDYTLRVKYTRVR